MRNISTKKKSKFLTYILAFMPGAAEMYMGFIKMGASLMTVFGLSFYCLIVGMGFVGIASMVIWFIGFFHAINLYGTEDSKFAQVEDDWIWNEFFDGVGVKVSEKKKRKIVAMILIVAGVVALWDVIITTIEKLIPADLWDAYYGMVRDIFYDVPQFVIACIIIYIGIRMIKGKKRELLVEDKQNL